MSNERTASEAKAANIALMGESLGAVYSELWQEVAWIHAEWDHYVELFGTSEARIDLLNKVAPFCFRTIQDTLFEAILLHLARLTDPPKSTGKENLSLQRLTILTTDTPIGERVGQLTTAALAATEFARDWRNRRLAHRDLDLALGRHVVSLAPASRFAVKEALTALVDVLNAVSSHYADSTTVFDLRGESDCISILHAMRDGIRAQEEKLARLRSGSYSPDDIKHEAI